MEDMADKLAFQNPPAGWGAMHGRPITIPPGRTHHAGVLLAGPPFTVCWTVRADETTLLTVRFPLIIWLEEDAVILPPDDAQGTPFYQDPPGQPGLHRDLFKTWARRVAAALLMEGYPMSPAVVSHLPKEYQSDSDSDAQPVTPRSVSPPQPKRWTPTADSSEMEDNSSEEGPTSWRWSDSSDWEVGAGHRDGARQRTGGPMSAGLVCAPIKIQQEVEAQQQEERRAAAAASGQEPPFDSDLSDTELAEQMGLEIVTAILDERPKPKRRKGSTAMEYLVLWEGYRPEWEADYRQGRGQVGDPFSTWESEKIVRKLDVFRAWKATQPGGYFPQSEQGGERKFQPPH